MAIMNHQHEAAVDECEYLSSVITTSKNQSLLWPLENNVSNIISYQIAKKNSEPKSNVNIVNTITVSDNCEDSPVEPAVLVPTSNIIA